ncbi:MAG: MFS transporter [Ktedonobacterales bacterium]
MLREGRTFTSLRRHRNFRLYTMGQAVSSAGSWAQMAALSWLVLGITHSALALGVLGVWTFGPYVALGLFGGVISDRFDRRRTLLVTQTAYLALAVALAALTWNDAAPLWLLYALSALDGFVQVVDTPTELAFVPHMVGTADLANAIGLNSAVFNATRIVGPAVAGLLIAAGGVRLVFALNAVSYLTMLGALLLMRSAELLRPAAPPERRVSPVRDLAEGFQYAWRTPAVRAPLVMVVAMATVTFNFTLWLTVLAGQTLRAGPQVFGIITASFAVGAMVGALAVATWARASWRALLASLGGVALGLALLAPLRDLLLMMLALVFVGAMRTIYLTISATLVQLATPGQLQGRIMGFYNYALLATATLTGPLVGWLTQVSGTTLVIALAAGVDALLCGAGLLWYLGGGRRVVSHPAGTGERAML